LEREEKYGDCLDSSRNGGKMSGVAATISFSFLARQLGSFLPIVADSLPTPNLWTSVFISQQYKNYGAQKYKSS